MQRRSLMLAAVLVAAACRRDAPAPESSAPAPVPDVPAPLTLRPTPDGTLTVHHGSQLVAADLAQVQMLDLAMAPGDQVGFLADLDPATTCDQVDLLAVAERAPQLQRLRISGCPAAIHAGLSAFGGRLRELTLADITFDGVTIGNLRELTGLRSLILDRVELGHDPLTPMRDVGLTSLELRDLERDSDLTLMLDLWPKSLQRVVFEGTWAGHNAMLTLARADALEVLELRGTRIGNFSINQIKGLEHLRELVFEGDTFNDNTPLLFRELPIERFVCTCERIGDGALRSLRHSASIRVLELRETQITGEGLEPITKMDTLEELVLLDRDLGPAGFANLAELPRLRRLELSGPVEDGKLTKLGMLVHLTELRLAIAGLDDAAAGELAELTALKILDLSGSQLSDTGVAQLAGLTALEELYLDGTRVTRGGLETLATLPNLRVLSLDRTDVVDAGVSALEHHPALRELRLDGTLVTDASVDTLLSMPELRRVSLARTVVSQAGVARLRAHPHLEALNIDDIRG